MRRSLFLLSLLAMGGATAARATTLVLPSDERLLAEAELVLDATVAASAPAAGEAATDLELDVARALKGSWRGAATVRLPGGVAPGGRRLRVWGAPQLAPGDRALFFLVRHRDGSLRPLHLAAGVFRSVAATSGAGLALRDLAETATLTPQGAPAPPEPARDYARFADWLATRAAGNARAADYVVATTAPQQLTAPYTYLLGTRQRWSAFDGGKVVSWRLHGGAGGAAAELATAVAAWNDDRDSNVLYHYAGATSAAVGFTEFDGENTVLFDDPNDEVAGSFACFAPGEGSGVLAIGGTWTAPGAKASTILSADIVVNDGAGCWMATAKRRQQILGHELGHTLGLGHACGDGRSGACTTSDKNEALMRATPHADERGAQLSADDRAALRDLYPASEPAGPPAPPTGLEAHALAGGEVELVWPAAKEGVEFVVEVASPLAAWHEATVVADGATTARLAALEPGLPYSFRVRARNGTGVSSPSPEASLTLPDGAACDAPPGRCLRGGRVRATVHWRVAGDGSHGVGTAVAHSDETALFWFFAPDNPELVVKVLDGVALTGAYWTFYGALSDVEYWITVRDAAGAAKTYHSPQGRLCGAGDVDSLPASASGAATTGGAPPAAAADAAAAATCGGEEGALCLLGRFRVEAAWRTPDGKTGRAVGRPLGDQSGTFWFFDAGNVELVVKAIDGRAVNDRWWLFYGALSDVAYDLTVTDTTTGAVRAYHNPQGNLCGRGDTAAFAD